MSKKRKPEPGKRRNAEARAAWRLGHRVQKSIKTYDRKVKHKNLHREDGGSFLSNVDEIAFPLN